MGEKVKKLMNLWKRNKIAIVLLTILAICFITICVIAATYFFGGSDSVYGDRLDDLEGLEISTKDITSYEDALKESELVDSVNVHIKGKIIYITINFVENTSLVEAQSVATASLESDLDAEYMEIYDINFILEAPEGESSDGFIILGARNVIANKVSWNNNTPIDTEEGE